MVTFWFNSIYTSELIKQKHLGLTSTITTETAYCTFPELLQYCNSVKPDECMWICNPSHDTKIHGISCRQDKYLMKTLIIVVTFDKQTGSRICLLPFYCPTHP